MFYLEHSPRKPESELTQKEMDIARSIQEVTEEIVWNGKTCESNHQKKVSMSCRWRCTELCFKWKDNA